MSDPVPDALQALLERGDTCFAEDRTEAAVTAFEGAVALCRALVADGVVARAELPRVILRLALALGAAGETAEAVRVCREGYQLTGALHGVDPGCTVADVARMAVNFGRHLAADGRADEALECAHHGLPYLDELTPHDPPTYLAWRAALLRAVVELVPESDDPPLRILDARRDLVATCRLLAEFRPDDVRRRRDLGEALVLLARAVAEEPAENGEDGEDGEPRAVVLAREAVSILRAAVSPPSGVNALARALAALSDLLSDLGRDADAEHEIAEASAALVEPWSRQLATLVVTWEWVLAPTFWKEQGVLEFADELLDPAADAVVSFALLEVPGAEATRLRALRTASRELGVAGAYQRRAEDPLGFLAAYA